MRSLFTRILADGRTEQEAAAPEYVRDRRPVISVRREVLIKVLQRIRYNAYLRGRRDLIDEIAQSFGAKQNRTGTLLIRRNT